MAPTSGLLLTPASVWLFICHSLIYLYSSVINVVHIRTIYNTVCTIYSNRLYHVQYTIVLYSKSIILFILCKFFPLLNMRLANPTYCKLTSVPTLSYANTPLPIQTPNSRTYFNCSLGYISTGAPNPPYFDCLIYNITDGKWSTVNYTCDCMKLFLYCKLVRGPSQK